MTYYRFPETRLTKAAFGVFLFALLYLARDTLVTSSLLGFYQAQFLMLGLCGLVGILFLLYHRKQWKPILLDRRIPGMGICAVLLLLPMLGKRDWQMMYFSVLLCAVIPLFFTYFVTLKETARWYVLIVAFLSAWSLPATYLLRILPDQGLWAVPVVHNQIGVAFYNFVFSFVSLSFVPMRNFGIFREPGVHQFFLILALYLNHYKVQWEKPWKMWALTGLLSVTMISTFATGGVLELALLAMVVFFDQKLYRKKWMLALVLVLAVLAGIGLAYLIDAKNDLYCALHDMVIGKFIYQEENVHDRVGSVIVSMEAFLRNPLLGSKIRDVLYGIANNTTSTLILFGIMGLGGGILHVAGWIALVWKKEQKLWVNLALLLILFMSFNTQNLIADMFLWLFPMMALAEAILPVLEGKKDEV